MSARRFFEVDALKASGIALVVLIHCIRAPWDPTTSPFEDWLGHWTRFGVPAFLVGSGFLYATGTPPAMAQTAQRLARVGAPYLIVSLLAQVWWHMLGVRTETGHVWSDLAFGASMGPFYYVFIILCLIVATPVFARLPEKALAALCVVAVAAQWWVDAARGLPTSMFWHFRNPLMWWGYFLLGWQLRLHYDTACAWIAPRSTQLAIGLGASAVVLAALSTLSGPDLMVRSAAWLNIYVMLTWIVVLTAAKTGHDRWAGFSDATYAIFLLHMFFVTSAQRYVPAEPLHAGFIPIVVPWVAGMLGPWIVVAVARAAVGERSKWLVGA